MLLRSTEATAKTRLWLDTDRIDQFRAKPREVQTSLDMLSLDLRSNGQVPDMLEFEPIRDGRTARVLQFRFEFLL
jgi:hypothetical protein